MELILLVSGYNLFMRGPNLRFENALRHTSNQVSCYKDQHLRPGLIKVYVGSWLLKWKSLPSSTPQKWFQPLCDPQRKDTNDPQVIMVQGWQLQMWFQNEPPDCETTALITDQYLLVNIIITHTACYHYQPVHRYSYYSLEWFWWRFQINWYIL